MVFLILAAQYESWSLPLSVLLALPFGTFGALAAVWLRDYTNDVYFQIGLVTLLGLAAKNAILIVEYAVLKKSEGLSTSAAALEAARLRFRPILMTSLAFILGVAPLAFSSGAGAGARLSVGTGVMGGMLAATFLAIFFIPLFYRAHRRPAADRDALDAGDRGGSGAAPSARQRSRTRPLPPSHAAPVRGRHGCARSVVNLCRAMLAVALVIVATGRSCSLKLPPYQSPPPSCRPQWRDAPAQGRPSALASAGGRSTSDPVLGRLVEEALANNRDLAIAAARVDEARALLRITDCGACADRRRDGSARPCALVGALVVSASAGRAAPARTRTRQRSMSLTSSISGAVCGGASNAARAELLATQAARETVRIALASQVVQSYYTLIALDEQVDVTRRTIELRTQDLELQKHRNDAGLITDFNLRQLEAEVAAARAQLPAARAAAGVGRSRAERAARPQPARDRRRARQPAARRRPAGGARHPRGPAVGPAAAPARHRSGGAAAHRRERADRRRPRRALPAHRAHRLSGLGQRFARRSLHAGPRSSGSSRSDSRSRSSRAAACARKSKRCNARERQALAQYQKTVQIAFGEVREALVAQSRSREVYAAETERVAALRETLRLARIRFENGLSSQLEVIDAERNLLQAELNRLDALRAQRAAVADVVRTLGGGWTGLSEDSAQAAAHQASANATAP